ncbi:MAG: nicotinamide-nucleotide adenylyltransferase [Thermoplasmata archaeon]
MRCLLVGRFQPFHLGHLAVLRQMRVDQPTADILLGIGSAQESYTPLNPFTAGERYEMIARALAQDDLGAVAAVPIPDIQRHALWVAHVRSLLPTFEVVYTNNPLTRMLFEEGGYRVAAPALVERNRFEGAHVREEILGDRAWTELVPPAVAQYVTAIHGPERIRLLSAQGPTHPSDAASR